MHGGRAGRKAVHGRYSREAVAERRRARALLEALRKLLEQAEA